MAKRGLTGGTSFLLKRACLLATRSRLLQQKLEPEYNPAVWQRSAGTERGIATHTVVLPLFAVGTQNGAKAPLSPLSTFALRGHVLLGAGGIQALPLCLRRRRSSGPGPGGDSRLHQIQLPQTGEGIAECELLTWHVQEGDRVEQFQLLCEVQSDKASVEITSRYDGRVERRHFAPGDVVKVGETLLDIVPHGEDDGGPPAGSGLSHQDPVTEASAAAPTGGQPAGGEPQSEGPAAPAGTRGQRDVLATPGVRHLAKESRVDLASVVPTGRGGRVTKEDLLKYMAAAQGATGPGVGRDLEEPGVASPQVPPLSDGTSEAVEVDAAGARQVAARGQPHAEAGRPPPRVLRDTVIPIRGFRRAMARSMAATTGIPHFRLMEEINVGSLSHMRDALEETAGVKLTQLPFLVKALSAALAKFPEVNATVDADVTEITCRASHNIGIAMATPHGLVVPNIKDCQALSIFEIGRELARLRGLATENKLASEDVTGGTITVSNIGMMGGTYADPLINAPEVAIVALGRVRKLPRFDEEENVVAAPILPVSWAADHRVIDGATLADLCGEWKAVIEQPELLILHLR